jgi:hypothetical protein
MMNSNLFKLSFVLSFASGRNFDWFGLMTQTVQTGGMTPMLFCAFDNEDRRMSLS